MGEVVEDVLAGEDAGVVEGEGHFGRMLTCTRFGKWVNDLNLLFRCQLKPASIKFNCSGGVEGFTTERDRGRLSLPVVDSSRSARVDPMLIRLVYHHSIRAIICYHLYEPVFARHIKMHS